MKTLREQAIEAINKLQEEKIPDLIQFASFLRIYPNYRNMAKKVAEGKPLRQAGLLEGQIWMSDDFNDSLF